MTLSLLSGRRIIAPCGLEGGEDGAGGASAGGEDLAALDDHEAASPTWETWEREPLAWHGGVRVLPGGNGKWILQKFKELEAGVRGGGV